MTARRWLTRVRRRAGYTQETLAEALGVAARTVSRWETGDSTPTARVRGGLAAALGMPLEQLSGLDGPRPADESVLPPDHTGTVSPSACDAPPGTAAPSAGTRAPDSPDEDAEHNGQVRRRSFVALSSTAAFGALLSGATRPVSDVEAFAAVFSRYGDTGPLTEGIDLPALASEVAMAKRRYQGCRYAWLTGSLPGLLDTVQTTCQAACGDNERRRAFTLSAEAHHVAASLLLKHGAAGMAWIAADRSMRAAQHTGSPVMIASSARIVVHALMGNGHHAAAVATARQVAGTLDGELRGHPSPDLLSVYGALLLRGAIAAARDADRAAAADLLSAANRTAARLGGDHNLRWTAFGPTNVLQHRVNVAVTVADAGAAIDTARRIDIDAIPITERKAGLLIDTARAFTQQRRHDQAYRLLRAADTLAHDELTTRPAVHRMVADLAATAPPSTARDIRQLADHIGAPV